MYKYILICFLILLSPFCCAQSETIDINDLPEVKKFLNTIGKLVGINTSKTSAEDDGLDKSKKDSLSMLDADLTAINYIVTLKNEVYVPYSHEYVELLIRKVLHVEMNFIF